MILDTPEKTLNHEKEVKNTKLETFTHKTIVEESIQVEDGI